MAAAAAAAAAVVAVAVAVTVLMSVAAGQGLNADVLGLIVLKAELKDTNGALASWTEDDNTPCTWKHVQCNDRSHRVTQLHLSSLGLSGKIGRGISMLELLQTLDISHNNISGSLTPDLSRLPALRVLNVGHNGLSGVIPDKFFNQCSSLRVLSLAHNSLSGTLSSTISLCSSLISLNLSSNHLSGTLPSRLWMLRNLRSLDLSGNSFSGSVPNGIAALSSLRDLRLNNNKFSGDLPSEIGSCTLLKSIDFSHNAFHSSIPESLKRLGMLLFIDFSHNNLTGVFSSWIGSLSKLDHLDLAYNSLEGVIPTEISSLKNLMLLNVSSNKLSGSIPESLESCTMLASVDLSRNNFSGSLRTELFELNLQKAVLSWNKLSGNVPRISSQSLQVLDLSHNALTGPFPTSVAQCSRLEILDLSDNHISSAIPPQLGNLKLLTVLDLRNNKLSGRIPQELSHITTLSTLQLDGNALSGPIPKQIGNCARITLLSLSHNGLTGTVPEEIAKLHGLKILDLSMNHLTGELPQQLGNLGGLMAVNVSHNRLKGRIPTGGIFNFLNDTALGDNDGLCGSAVNVSCPSGMAKPIVLNPNSTRGGVIRGKGEHGMLKSRHNRIVLSVSAIIAISAAAAIAFGVIAVTILNIRAQSSSRSMNHVLDSFSQSPSTDMTLGKLVMFSPSLDPGSEDWVASAHSLLNKDCELGRGGFGTVYKAVLGDGRMVAIKKLMVSSLVKSQEDFEREVQLLGKVKHPNLVNLHGYYWTPQLQLLIYEYIQSGSLYSKLHERSGNDDPPLTWSIRYDIAVGIARGIAHLHHGCRPSVIHYNIKSSNILLDDECNPKVADFGLAKLLPMLDRYILSSKIQSALGYMAPEFACQSLKINEKCDVYGFGVLLLELVTGRRPVEYMEDDVIILCDNVRSLLDEGRALSCVDATLGSYPEDEVIPVLKLGLVCTSQVPSNRPSMAEVLHILELIKSPAESRDSI